MRILHINKFMYVAGGVERYMFEVGELCRREGHETLFFGMEHPRNEPCEQSPYFVSQIEYNDTSLGYKIRNAPTILGKTVYSFEARRQLRKLLQEYRPDVAHLHLFSHQISPSILHELSAFNIPSVWTLQEYKFVCPSYHLYIHHKHEICERCVGGAYWNAARQRCLKNSLAASTLAAAAQYIHHWMRIHEKHIDLYLAPSEFMADKMKEGGLPADRLRIVRNHIELSDYAFHAEPGDYVLYFGRISPEKGLGTLLNAAARTPKLEYRIAGEGPDEETLRQRAAELGLQNVRFLGYTQGEELKELIAGAGVVVVPSEWYENAPLVILESFALGRPVVGARIGGIPELTTSDTGGLFEPGDDVELADRLQTLMDDPEERRVLGRAARERVEGICGAQYADLMAAYREAAERRHVTLG